MKVREIYDWVDGVAPFETQEAYDNSGMLVGDPEAEVRGIYCALDVNGAVLDAAEKAGANLILTHHPMLFGGRKNLLETPLDHEGRLLARMIRGHMALIAAHTNLDQAPGGINDTLAELCGLANVQGEGFFRFGDLPEALPAADCAAFLSERLGDSVRLMGPADAPVRRIGLCSGGGSGEWTAAAQAGCDAFLSGEIKHHHALAMAESGLVAFECGHFATEFPGVSVLASALQNALCAIECNVRVYVSEAAAYAFPRKK